MCDFVSGVILKKNYGKFKKYDILIYDGISHSDTCEHFNLPYGEKNIVVEWEWLPEGILMVRDDVDSYFKICIEDKFKTFKNLIKSQINNDAFSENAVDWAARNGHLKMVKLFIKYGVTPTEDAVDWAAENGHLEMVKFLIKYGVTPTVRAVDRTAKYGHLEMVKFLIEHKVIPTEDAVNWAAMNGHLEIVKLLTT